MDFYGKKIKERKKESVLFTSLGITAMGANNSIFVASHNSLL
jgi:hypothetical protein